MTSNGTRDDSGPASPANMPTYADLLEVLRTRRSVRRFERTPVSRAELMQLFEAARWAPSNHNRQPWSFLVFEDPARIAILATAVRRGVEERLAHYGRLTAEQTAEFVRYATLFAEAPVVIAALHRHRSGMASALLGNLPDADLISGEPLSVAMAVQNLLLAASTLGLGACMLTAPLVAGETLTAALAPPPGCAVTCLIAVGRAAESPVAPRRKEAAQIVTFRDVPN